MLVCFGIIFFFFMRNLFVKDYEIETKTFLTKVGRADAIKQMFPPTRKEILRKAYEQELDNAYLAGNVTLLVKQYSGLRRDLDSVLSKLNVKTESSVAGISQDDVKLKSGGV